MGSIPIPGTLCKQPTLETTMDPNIVLADLKEMVDAIIDNEDEGTSSQLIEFAEAFNALDHWMSVGGFLPTRWER
jgi:hypothetical protein